MLQISFGAVFTILCYYLSDQPMETFRIILFLIIGALLSITTEGIGLTVGTLFRITVIFETKRHTCLEMMKCNPGCCLLFPERSLYWSYYRGCHADIFSIQFRNYYSCRVAAAVDNVLVFYEIQFNCLLSCCLWIRP